MIFCIYITDESSVLVAETGESWCSPCLPTNMARFSASHGVQQVQQGWLAAVLVLLLLVAACPTAPAATDVEEVELGVYDINSQETSPVLWYGELLLVEGRMDSGSPADMHIHVGGEPLFANGSSHFRVRKQALLGHGTNEDVINLIPHTVQISFCNAYVQESGAALGNTTLWVFGTNDDDRWGAPARTQVHAFWSSDPALQIWNHSIALRLPAGYQAFNTDVTAGPGGYAYMAVELGAPAAIVGTPFTSVFARTAATDLSAGWALLDPVTHVYTTARYSACPTLRYFAEDEYFYMTTLFGNVPNSSTAAHTTAPMDRPAAGAGAGAGTAGYPCCFVTYLVRSRDLIVWEGAARNPIMGWQVIFVSVLLALVAVSNAAVVSLFRMDRAPSCARTPHV